MKYTLVELAQLLDVRLESSSQSEITGVATLHNAQQGDISFFHNAKYRSELINTKASAVLLSVEALADCPCAALVADDPYYAYTKLAQLFAYQPKYSMGVHPTAVIGENCQLDPSVIVGPHVVIENNVLLAKGVIVGAGCFIGEGCQIGEDSQLQANVTLYHHVKLARRVLLASGVVVGSDGFGHAMHEGRWYKVPQLGGVVIEDDVEVGANTTIDRGALADTRIGKGVKLDNQIQIGHNVQIGEHTAVAACVGVAGSAKIGRYCMIAGGAGINGHIEIADKTVVTGMAMVTNSIKKSGVYSSGTGLMPNQVWRKNIVRLRQLDKLARQVKKLMTSAGLRGKEE